MGDGGNGKRKGPEGINQGKSAFWEIAKIVKCKNNSPEAIDKGKSAFWEMAKMVKYKKALKELMKGKVLFGSRA